MTLPRTTASALLSPARRSPSRRWNASSTASFTSFVSAGSAVWLSKGRIATVLMLGRPPPAKPYRQPPSATASALTAPAPNRRIEHRGRIDQDHRKLKPSPLLRKIHAGARRHPLSVEFRAAARQHFALSPPLRLEDPRAAARLPVVERVTVLREPPDQDARIRTPAAEDAGFRRGRPHDPERRPQHPHRRDQRAEVLLRVGPEGRIGDDGGRARAQSQRPDVIEAQRIRRCDARLPTAPPPLLVVLILPPEPDRGVARRKRRPTPGNGRVPVHRGQRLRHQRRRRARTAGQQRTGANVEECYPRVKRKMLRSQDLNLTQGVGMVTIESTSVYRSTGSGIGFSRSRSWSGRRVTVCWWVRETSEVSPVASNSPVAARSTAYPKVTRRDASSRTQQRTSTRSS